MIAGCNNRFVFVLSSATYKNMTDKNNIYNQAVTRKRIDVQRARSGVLHYETDVADTPSGVTLMAAGLQECR